MAKKSIFILFVLILFVACLFIFSQETGKEEEELKKVEKPSLSPKIKPDLVLEKVWLTSEIYSRGKTKVTIHYTVFNDSSVVSSCCPTDKGEEAWEKDPINHSFFLCTVESGAHPGGRLAVLPLNPNKGTYWVALNPHEKKDYDAFIIMDTGASKKFRVKVDAGDWIDETKEDNNTGTAIWPQLKRKKDL